MDDDDNFFAMPPSGGGDGMDAPILLGGPPQAPPPPPGDDDFGFMNVPSGDHAPEPTYLGDVNDAHSTDGAPIVLGPPDDMMMGGDMTGGYTMAGEEEQPEDQGPQEPSPMQKWNAEWQETLMKRKDEENARKAEIVEAARIAMEKFHAEREQRRELKMAKNREDEQAKLEAIEADLENDNSWQRVCKMIELSHDSTAKAQDTKRMRDVLILLKNDPARADVLSK